MRGVEGSERFFVMRGGQTVNLALACKVYRYRGGLPPTHSMTPWPACLPNLFQRTIRIGRCNHHIMRAGPLEVGWGWVISGSLLDSESIDPLFVANRIEDFPDFGKQ